MKGFCAAVVPAAGKGERFGGGKLLAPVDGTPMLERTIHTLLEAGIADVVVVLAPEPAPDFFIVDRFLGAAELANIAALIVRNKADLHVPGEGDAELANYAAIGYPIVVVSAQRNQGIAQLAEHLRGMTT